MNQEDERRAGKSRQVAGMILAVAVAAGGVTALAITTGRRPSLVGAPGPSATPSDPTPSPTSSVTMYSTVIPAPTRTVWMTPGDSETPSPTPTIKDCTARDLNVAVAASKTDYAQGEPVLLSYSMTNESTVPCNVYTNWVPLLSILDEHGTKVADVGYCPSNCPPHPDGGPVRPEELDPGISMRGKATWDQSQCDPLNCSKKQIPAGTYSAVATYPDDATGVSAPFTIGG